MRGRISGEEKKWAKENGLELGTRCNFRVLGGITTSNCLIDTDGDA